jgi:hypothetical protein
MEFEHRDLHWGNVLLQRCGAEETRTARLNGRGCPRAFGRLVMSLY